MVILLVFKTSYNYVVQLDLSLTWYNLYKRLSYIWTKSMVAVTWDSQWTRIV